MHVKSLRPLAILALALGAVALVPVLPAAQTSGSPERFTTFAVDMGGWGPTRSGTLEIVVSRWSTPKEQTAFIERLNEHGSDALLDSMRKAPRVGYIRTPGNLGWPLRFAQDTVGEDGGRKILLITDRPIDPWEAFSQPRSIDYPFTVVELRMPPSSSDRAGEGTMWMAAQLSGTEHESILWIQDYELQPVRLTQVRSHRQT